MAVPRWYQPQRPERCRANPPPGVAVPRGSQEKGLNTMKSSTSCTTRRNFVKTAGVAAASTMAMGASVALADEAA